MKIDLFVGVVTPEFEVSGYEENEAGEHVPIPGEAVYRVSFEPALLNKKELEELLSKTKNHAVEVKL